MFIYFNLRLSDSNTARSESFPPSSLLQSIPVFRRRHAIFIPEDAIEAADTVEARIHGNRFYRVALEVFEQAEGMVQPLVVHVRVEVRPVVCLYQSGQHILRDMDLLQQLDARDVRAEI